jgi:hypothetical protein
MLTQKWKAEFMTGVLKKNAPEDRFQRWFNHTRAEMISIQS